MFAKFFAGLFAKGGASVIPVLSKSADPFAGFELLQRGLKRRVKSYIELGTDEAVLKEVAAKFQSAQGNQHFRVAYMSGLNSMLPLVCADHGQLARYALLCEASGRTPLVTKQDAYRLETPEPVRILFSFFKRDSIDVDVLIDATALLGGSEVDVVVHLVQHIGYSSRVRVNDAEQYFERIEPSVLIAAFERLDTKTRAKALSWSAPAAKCSAAFLDYLFVQFAAGSSLLAESARNCLKLHEPTQIEQRAIDGLSGGSAALRTNMVQVLGSLGTDTALCALKAHKEKEKAQSVQNALAVYLSVPEVEYEASGNGYIDVNDTLVEVTERAPLVDDGERPVGGEFLAEMQRHEAAVYASEVERYQNRLSYWNEHGRKHSEPKKPERSHFAQAWLDILNTPVDETPNRLPHIPYRHAEPISASLSAVAGELPIARVIGLACRVEYTLSGVLNRASSPLSSRVQTALRSGEIGLSQVVAIAGLRNTKIDYSRNDDENETYGARFVRASLNRAKNHYDPRIQYLDDFWEVAWPHLDVIAEALPPRSMQTKVNLAALELLSTFPSLPKALLQPVLFAAIDERTKLQKPAQDLLVNVPGLDDLLITLVSDKRQAVRANAARFLAKRRSKEALPAIVKRLKTEKSELARADLISAVAELGGDTHAYLGKDALLNEASVLVSKLPNTKFEWLELNLAPTIQWADGSVADPILLDGWLRLAQKLNDPGGSPLFRLYFQQLAPQSAVAVSDWVLNAWIAYDSYAPASAEVRAEAEKRVKQVQANPQNWMNRVYSEEQMLEHFVRSLTTGYKNSAAESKGLLALTHAAKPAPACANIARYLKQHGQRVSQAKSLLNALFGMDTKDAIQVLVATSTRFKQRTVRELAETLVTEIAEKRGWTEDALADRSVPSGGFETNGVMPLLIGEESKAYVAELGSDLSVKLMNPDGKEVKSIPAGKDENTKASKALLSAAKKTIKTVTAQQEARLYEAMLTPRIWALEDWQNDLTTHPILKRLIERVIWRGLDESGEVVATFRLTPEGEFLNADGDDVELSSILQVDLAHTANLLREDCASWQRHLRDFEVKALFPQVSRPVRKLEEGQVKQTRIDDREGWMTSTFKLRTAAKKAGYERGPIEDAGGFRVYRKEFRSAGIWADLHFTGSSVPEDDFATAVEYVQFSLIGANGFGGGVLQLGQVPKLLLSEVWNDLHEIAKTGAFDADWRKKSYF